MDSMIFLYLAFLVALGLLSTRLMKIVRLPNVTGYIIVGILAGPFVFGLLFNGGDFLGAGNLETNPIYAYVDSLSWVSTLALGFIAFSIGSSFKMSALRKVGKRVIVITILESAMASIMVIAALLIAHFVSPESVPLPLLLTLGAIAAATAPAATLMVIKQYRAQGPVVSTLLPVVALDDASALILFAVLFQIAKTLALGGDFDLYQMLLKPFIEIAISLGIGVILGAIVTLMCHIFKSRANHIGWIIFVVFAAVGLYYLFRFEQMGSFELSSLLTCMMAGAIYVNFDKNCGLTFDFLDRFTAPIFMLFFILSGASLDLTVFAREGGYIVIVIALIYLLSRVVGKWIGAFGGAALTRAEAPVKKYLGFCLIPQAGVAIGLASTASSVLGESQAGTEVGAMVLAVILTSTLIYELTGPLVTKAALTKAGEIKRKTVA